MKEEKIIERLDKAVEKLTAEEYAELFTKEPRLKVEKTRFGMTACIVCVSRFAARILWNYRDQLEKFGEVNVWDCNYLTVAVIYGIDSYDYPKFKELYQRLKKEIKGE